MQLAVSFNHDKYTDDELRNSIVKILSANNTLALSTVRDETGYINTAHYGFSAGLELFLITAVETQHSKNAVSHPQVGVAIWNRPAVAGTNLEGLQLFGNYELVKNEDIAKAYEAYVTNIPSTKEGITSPEDFVAKGLVFHKITVEKIKLLDEPNFGRRNYIELTVLR